MCFLCNFYLVLLIGFIHIKKHSLILYYNKSNEDLIEELILMNSTVNITSGMKFCVLFNMMCSVDGKFLNLPPLEDVDVKTLALLLSVFPQAISFLIFLSNFIKGIKEYKKDYRDMCKGRGLYKYKEYSPADIIVSDYFI